jgi:hypothetical protein
MYCISAPPPKQNGTAANAAVTCAHFPPPISLAINPVNTTAAACATAAKNRNPTSDVPNNSSATRPQRAVIGGYCTYPQARCRASSNAISSSRLNPYLHPVTRCTSTVPDAIIQTIAVPPLHQFSRLLISLAKPSPPDSAHKFPEDPHPPVSHVIPELRPPAQPRRHRLQPLLLGFSFPFAFSIFQFPSPHPTTQQPAQHVPLTTK